MYSPLPVGSLLHKHYRIQNVLRQGRCGWIYLAIDQTQQQEFCVLEEWIVLEETPQDSNLNEYPQQSEQYLEDLKEELQHEFGQLNQLNPSQFAHYQTALIYEQRLYLVREYIVGQTYRSLLKDRLAGGQSFSELEVRHLFETILPTLNTLHKRQIFHQHLTPDCIVLSEPSENRSSHPVLVEFGLPIDHLLIPCTAFAPPEQRLENRIAPDSDLYALAAIALVLLTGCPPEDLYDGNTQRWTWQGMSISPQFSQILDRMLSPSPNRRYSSARRVMDALRATQPEDLENEIASKRVGDLVLATVLIGLASIAAWRIILHLSPTVFASAENAMTSIKLERIGDTPPAATPSPSQPSKAPPRTVAVSPDLLEQLVNEIFSIKYPQLKDKLNTEKPPEWNAISTRLTNSLEQLSQESQIGMGNYNRASYNTWLLELQSLKVTDQSIEVLTDAKFLYSFPELERKQMNPRTLGQVWYAIAQNQINATKNQSILKNITSQATLSETLKAGQGKLYTVQLQKGQKIQLSLKVPSKSASLSIVSPDDLPLVRESIEPSWSGRIEQTGTYQIVIVPKTRKAIPYELKLASTSPG
ncbi:MAG: hypothetical protein KME13_01530 [Myxacorys californica WJT36-NPBG1]|jgi:serine/threonine-protein kinase|nr:hypothetical protein [Myxacorys californica WJT36-NPBG1]